MTFDEQLELMLAHKEGKDVEWAFKAHYSNKEPEQWWGVATTHSPDGWDFYNRVYRLKAVEPKEEVLWFNIYPVNSRYTIGDKHFNLAQAKALADEHVVGRVKLTFQAGQWDD